jgi:hypothetical protein
MYFASKGATETVWCAECDSWPAGVGIDQEEMLTIEQAAKLGIPASFPAPGEYDGDMKRTDVENWPC